MAASAARNARRKDSDAVSYKIGAVVVYKGTLLSIRTDGYAYPARTGTAGDIFIGVADETVDNSGGVAGDKSVLVRKVGTFVFAKTTAVIADVGIAMYAADDETVTATTTNNQLVGYACGLVDSANLRVRIDLAAK